MPKYSVAEAKNGLPGLIDRALAGEEVVITRRGKATVELRAVTDRPGSGRSQEEWMEWLRAQREAGPKVGVTSLELKRLEQEDYRR